jgi:hypothetical protein
LIFDAPLESQYAVSSVPPAGRGLLGTESVELLSACAAFRLTQDHASQNHQRRIHGPRVTRQRRACCGKTVSGLKLLIRVSEAYDYYVFGAHLQTSLAVVEGRCRHTTIGQSFCRLHHTAKSSFHGSTRSSLRERVYDAALSVGSDLSVRLFSVRRSPSFDWAGSSERIAGSPSLRGAKEATMPHTSPG